MNFLNYSQFLAESLDYTQIMPLTEGVHDKHQLKAVFVYGGPGSGKSYIISRLFDIPEQGFQTISYSTGLKSVNPDTSFEHQLKKIGIDLRSLDSLDDKSFQNLTVGIGSPRDIASKVTKLQANFFTTSRLGLIIQGTGKTFETVRAEVSSLRALGYDCYCIYVNTPLRIALERNAQRERQLPKSLVEDAWQKSQDNLGKITNEFGIQNCVIVDNGDKSKTNEIVSSTQKKIQVFLNRPLVNLIGIEWLKRQENSSKI
jgi:dephospho-CoA kinase